MSAEAPLDTTSSRLAPGSVDDEDDCCCWARLLVFWRFEGGPEELEPLPSPEPGQTQEKRKGGNISFCTFKDCEHSFVICYMCVGLS